MTHPPIPPSDFFDAEYGMFCIGDGVARIDVLAKTPYYRRIIGCVAECEWLEVYKRLADIYVDRHSEDNIDIDSDDTDYYAHQQAWDNAAAWREWRKGNGKG